MSVNNALAAAYTPNYSMEQIMQTAQAPRRSGFRQVLGGIVGGWLFDNWKPVGPFLYMAGSNGFMVLLAIGVFITTRRATAAAALKQAATAP